MTAEERRGELIEIWTKATNEVAKEMETALPKENPLWKMINSGARGNLLQLRQISAIRGLVANPKGEIIPRPIKASFREGLSVLEYFISTHGARKGLADTALRTADSGYLTRRLVDVSQDVIIREEDCGTDRAIPMAVGQKLADQLVVHEHAETGAHARTLADDIKGPDGQLVAHRGDDLNSILVGALVAANVETVRVRSVLTCESKLGVCAACYGRSLPTGKTVDVGEAVGIIAAQSIGEPGTQLTMRTFHTGGVAGEDITQGLPRVEELFEARVPKGVAIISAIEGRVEIERGEPTKARIVSSQVFTDEVDLPQGFELVANVDQEVEAGQVIARRTPTGDTAEEAVSQEALALLPDEDRVLARSSGRIVLDGDKIMLRTEEREDAEYVIPAAARLRVEEGQWVGAGEQLTEGAVNPQDILQVLGRESVQQYLVDEVQRVYRSQGVSINDKHIELIARQMLRKVRVDTPGDTELLPGEIVDRFHYEEVNARVLAEGGEPATAQTVLLGVTKASLSTESFLAAASFQETTRVLTEAAVNGSKDRLLGLKENVIIGKLIPAGTGWQKRLEREHDLKLAAEAAEEAQDEQARLEAAALNLFGA